MLFGAGCISERAPATAPTISDRCGVPVSAVGAGKALVLISNFAFFPETLHVAAGTSVTWVNCDTPDQHTSTSDGDVWSSPLLSPSDAFAFTFAQAGTFPYHCSPHPFMKAAVVVQ